MITLKIYTDDGELGLVVQGESIPESITSAYQAILASLEPGDTLPPPPSNAGDFLNWLDEVLDGATGRWEIS